jgi:hypothetical protein
MRSLAMLPLAAALALAACEPDVTSGAYLCGDEELCPKGQVCNGADHTCVNPLEAQPFACDSKELHEPDDTSAQAFALPTLGCVSNAVIDNGCLAAGDPQNWLAFATPANCVAVGVKLDITYPIAFEPLAVELWNLDTNQQLATDSACTSGAAPSGEDQRCLVQTLANSTHYGVVVEPAGGADCNGNCNFNRYTLTLQLATP